MADYTSNEGPVMDLSDVEPRVGQLVGGGQLSEPCNRTDIRRWVMAMDYVNPLHWDHHFAARTRFGDVIAPQSMCVSLDYGHGCQPACVGHIPGSHLIFGGEEWWWYGTHVRPGDQLFQERRFHDYKVTDTKFAGPTMFSRGDTIHRNQRGDLIAKARSTAIRYLAKEAEKRGMYDETAGEPKRWTRVELAEIDKIRHEWFMSNREGKSPHWEEVSIGDRLPRRVIGPHSIASFTTEYRAFIFNIWGSFDWVAPEGVKDPWVNQDPGWVEGFGFDEELAKYDPRARDGLYVGPSRGHIDDSYAGEVGMSRAYGYGATMAAWNTDYLAFWAGHDGLVRHAKSDFRSPAFEGDVTYIDGEVVDKIEQSEWGVPIVQIKVKMTDQNGKTVVSSLNEVELPF
ncbi:FAS1-like dehydratase domain-containing protein [Novosphingobium album (ex Liu et al. 2023)]|uniref:MaoC family dehydratase N-terminal domain-containing protein n=1 Tax=Novosphingobium album (ex Liu et al. 2023) TaxID=3031130 RepID=A0ABT5WUA0_9SPHN|nr:MaoC family dehydratase N-terminal domain-containing protein [Novosphingobium album (ex Liu et al. 2023)]MDE8653480.1 MaoC family dehydratase N-terminal domain-containing protein [Novosphingobium album (ex Liu et al. 2023)]